MCCAHGALTFVDGSRGLSIDVRGKSTRPREQANEFRGTKQVPPAAARTHISYTKLHNTYIHTYMHAHTHTHTCIHIKHKIKMQNTNAQNSMH